MDEGKTLWDLDRAACGGILALSPRGRKPRGGFSMNAHDGLGLCLVSRV